jgi:hypothetical protein
MRILIRTGKGVMLVVGIVYSVVIFSCAQPEKSTGKKVEISETLIVIHPTVKLSSSDEKKLNDVLNKYDKRLYKVEKVQNKEVKTSGHLKDMHISEAFKAEVAAAKAQGVSGIDIQLICRPPCHVTQNLIPVEKKKDLVKELEPILENY